MESLLTVPQMRTILDAGQITADQKVMWTLRLANIVTNPGIDEPSERTISEFLERLAATPVKPENRAPEPIAAEPTAPHAGAALVGEIDPPEGVDPHIPDSAEPVSERKQLFTASKAAIALAAEMGVDVSQVLAANGKKITKTDVQNYLDAQEI